MKSFFTSSFFATNRQKLRHKLGSDVLIIVTANGLLQRGGDSNYTFSQDANFWYLTGIDEPDIILIMDTENEYLIVPSRSAVRTVFDGTVTSNTLIQRSGVKQTLDDKTGWEQLYNRIKKVKKIATVAAAPSYIEQHGLFVNPSRSRLAEKIRNANPEVEFQDIARDLAQFRMVKQAPEIQAIQTAVDITVSSISATLMPELLARYKYEYEIEAELSREFRRRGASGHGFDPIVASGPRACVLHNTANNSKLTKNELITLDVGAEVEHYSADITRTISRGQPSKRQMAVHKAVAEVQQFSFNLLKPGAKLRDNEHQIEHFLGEKLRELGLIKQINQSEVRKYYPHSTSHFLGLNVHDAGDYELPLEAGVVLTVEPGIYISEEGIGVRIEDDVILTPDGIKILSDKLPRLIN
ncbi:MAG TPA: Xaa-Pro peptidase family protein [Candidatus Saccharimonadales bacterium]|nr:Xaa-Pro peptidase family protein [Candidatus Saccharimonadales bacterium]